MATDKINESVINGLLKTKAKIILYETTDSTNLRLKEAAKAGADTGTVIIAENQTLGRGRLGRTFHSPEESGIYMSLLLRPTSDTDVGLLTAHTAVAVCSALDEAFSEVSDTSESHKKPSDDAKAPASPNNSFGIKWVNDILKDGKKVCGILAEAGIENGKVEYIIIGIGINVYPPKEGFPNDIKHIAGSVFDSPKENLRNKIIASIINNFFAYSPDFIHEYKRRSVILGKEINVHKRDSIKKALAIDIDENCNLIVKYENGEIEKLSFGEISIRTINSGEF